MVFGKGEVIRVEYPYNIRYMYQVGLKIAIPDGTWFVYAFYAKSGIRLEWIK